MKNDAGKTLLEVDTDKIICFEANDNYVITYYLDTDLVLNKSMERISLKRIQETLGEGNQHFFRVHKSFIVNKSFVEAINGKSQAFKIKLTFIDSPLPVSRSFDITQIS